MENVTIYKIDTREAVQSINDLRQNIKLLKEQLGKLEIGTNDYKDTLIELNVNQAALKAAMNGTSASMQEVEQAARGAIDANTGLGVSYNALVNQMAEMRKVQRNLNISTAEGQAEYERYATEIAKVNDRLKSLDALNGNFQRNVGNYEGAIRGLNIATAQIVRELPSLSMSIDMFFLAISNNIPMLFDQIEMLKKQNLELQAQGKQGISIVKQVAKSFASWNTLLSVGVALLTMFGGKLVDWIKGMIQGKESTDEASESLKLYNEALQDIAKAESNATADARTYYSIATDVNRSMEDRLGAAQALISAYPQYLSQFSAEEVAAGKAGNAYRMLSESILEAARSKAAMSKITENYSRMLEIEQQITEKQAEMNRLQTLLSASELYSDKFSESNAFSYAAGLSGANVTVGMEVTSYRKQINSLTDDINSLNKQLSDLASINETLRGNVTFGDNAGSLIAQSFTQELESGLTQGIEDINLTDVIDKFRQDMLNGLLSPQEAGEMARQAAEAIAQSQLAALDRQTQHRLTMNRLSVEDDRQAAAQQYAIQQEANTRRLELLRQYLEQARSLNDGEAALAYQQQISDLEIQIEEQTLAEKMRLRRQDYQDQERMQKMQLTLMQQSSAAVSSILGSIADIYEANSGDNAEVAEKIKGIRIAGATIDTISGALTAYTTAQSLGPIAGPIVGALNAAAVTAAGLAQIAQIRNTDITGSSTATPSGISATVSAPSVSTEVPTVRNLTGASEEERLNRMAGDQRVYILASDIEASQNQRKVQVRESSF